MSDEIKVQAKNKKTKLFIAIAAAVIAVITIVVVTLAVSNRATAKKLKEQLSLGEKYLSELDYEQAIAAYELANAYVGSYVKFGSYEQDNDLSNGKEKIEWLVLDLQANEALLISKYGGFYGEGTLRECVVRPAIWVNLEE